MDMSHDVTVYLSVRFCQFALTYATKKGCGQNLSCMQRWVGYDVTSVLEKEYKFW